MLEEIYPSPTKPKPYVVNYGQSSMSIYPSDKDKELAAKLKITTGEVLRRNEILARKWRESRLYTNCSVRPKNEKEFEKYGILKVSHFCQNIHDYKEEWPKDDDPYVLTIWSAKAEKTMVCTLDYVEMMNGAVCN